MSSASGGGPDNRGRRGVARTWRSGMTRYLISFDDGAMTFPPEDLPEVAKSAHEVVERAKQAGVWIFGGGIESHEVSIVATDGSVTDGPTPGSRRHIGGFSIIDVPSHE